MAACPLVAYSQGGVDLCAAYGLASAVHCFGDTVAATAIARSARAALASGDAFGHIRTVVRSEVAGWSEVPLVPGKSVRSWVRKAAEATWVVDTSHAA